MDIAKVKEVWNKVKEQLRVDLPEHVFSTWVNPIEAADYENNTLVLFSPHPMAIDILKKSWAEKIKESVKMVLGDDAAYSLNYDADYAKKYIKARKNELAKQIAGQTEEEKQEYDAKKTLAQMRSDANLNLNLKFENFVVGDNSSFAYNAAFAVANNPAKKINPLFIYGVSGLGKTHLLQAIGHYIIFNKPNLKVRYVRMEEYFNEWVKCFQHNTTSDKKRSTDTNNALMRKFHQKFQNIDVLLMDDIQFIESKSATMKEFFSTFVALYTNNKQIVIASDRLPADIPKLDNRLRSRFEEGLVVDIKPPAFETRVEIVKAYAASLGVDADDDVFTYIADNFVNNVRELKGAFNKVSAYAEFFNHGVTLETAQKALNCEVRKKDLTIDKIAKCVADYYGIKLKELKTPSRQQKISKARQLAAYLARDVLGTSYEAIGDYFAKKHTTMMYACNSVVEKLKTDSDLQNTIDEIKVSFKE